MGPRSLENFNIVTTSYFSPNLVLKVFLMRGQCRQAVWVKETERPIKDSDISTLMSGDEVMGNNCLNTVERPVPDTLQSLL